MNKTVVTVLKVLVACGLIYALIQAIIIGVVTHGGQQNQSEPSRIDTKK